MDEEHGCDLNPGFCIELEGCSELKQSSPRVKTSEVKLPLRGQTPVLHCTMFQKLISISIDDKQRWAGHLCGQVSSKPHTVYAGEADGAREAN